MKSTRDRVMQTLLAHPRATIQELADSVGLNNISVRHHLNSLSLDGFVGCEEERHGVGRPRLVYFLTELGFEKFPTSYLKLTTRLLTQLKSAMPAADVESLFKQIAMDMTEDYRDIASHLPLEGRLNLLQKMLATEGFNMDWEKVGDQYLIHEISCPYFHVGQSHPEICTVDKTVIASVLSIPVEKVSCVLGGSAQCTYLINQQVVVERVK